MDSAGGSPPIPEREREIAEEPFEVVSLSSKVASAEERAAGSVALSALVPEKGVSEEASVSQGSVRARKNSSNASLHTLYGWS